MNYSAIGKFVLACLFALSLGGCSNPEYDYTQFKQSKPSSILILPPVNESVEVDAEAAVLSALVRPVAEAGYYVIPSTLVSETFRQNGYSQAAEIQNIPLKRLNKIFGSDAVLYVTIKEYGQKYFVLGSAAVVILEGRLVDSDTGEEIWTGTASARSDENRSTNSGGIAGLLLEAVVTQIAEKISDQSYPTSKMAASRLVSPANRDALLYGPRHPKSEF